MVQPDQATKTLGVRMSLTGDYSAEKTHVLAETKRRTDALAQDRVLSSCHKEQTFKTGICSVFRYSAGLVPWTTTELRSLHSIWLRAYKQGWGPVRGTDDSPFLLDTVDGGRGCPSPEEVWIEEVKELYEQCINLPGVISQLAVHQLHQVCQRHACATLDQVQRMLRIGGRADTVEEWLLLRMDQRGMELSSPWAVPEGPLVTETLWPQLMTVWKDKMAWRGCTELSEALQERWEQVQRCLKATQHLGRAGVITVSQLVTHTSRWRPWKEVRHKDCSITELEYRTLLQCLDQVEGMENLREQAGRRPSDSDTNLHTETQCSSRTSLPVHPPCDEIRCTGALSTGNRKQALVPRRMPSCLMGRYRTEVAHDCVELGYCVRQVPDTPLVSMSDDNLARELCRSRAVFTQHLEETQTISVECLIPVKHILPSYSGPAMVIVQTFDAEGDSTDMAAFPVALIRDCFTATGMDSLREVCTRPEWRVPKEELRACFNASWGRPQANAKGWHLAPGGEDGQLTFRDVVHGVWQRRGKVTELASTVLQPWQRGRLPSNVKVDLTNHFPLRLPSPNSWEIWQRNARVVITDTPGLVVTMGSAQYGMLRDLYGGRPKGTPPEESFLQAVQSSCRAQARADSEYHVHWSRHLLARLCEITGAQLLVGARAVTFHPHFSYYTSPDETDELLGSTMIWPEASVILVLDAYPPSARQQILRRASTHASPVWVLRQDAPTSRAEEDIHVLRQLRAIMAAVLPSGSLVLHDSRCWSCAHWDAKAAREATHIWQLGGGLGRGGNPLLLEVQKALGCWQDRRYDFYWNANPTRPLQCYRENQQDACQYTWDGQVGASDGCADLRRERMGAGGVIGMEQMPTVELAAPVGGPLASLRAEAVGLLYLIRRTRDRFGVEQFIRLLIFSDCLGLLLILDKWGTSEFCPDPRDVVHFDVIVLLLIELRQWKGDLVLMKIKGHTGCMHNELADERADTGCQDEGAPLCPGPQKYGSLWVRIRPYLREAAEAVGKGTFLPRDSAPDRSILRRVASLNALRATATRSTIFVQAALHRTDSTLVRKVIDKCSEAAIRCWIKTMCGTYPTHKYLHRIKPTIPPWCPFCSQSVVETLTHFACVCPQFREARTAAHNQLRNKVANLLREHLVESGGWQLFEETRASWVGLQLKRVEADVVVSSGRSLPRQMDNTCDVGRLQPDLIAISWSLRKVAIIDISRPSDIFVEQLQSAYDRKIKCYRPLLDALQHYIADGWEVEIFPWVVGIRGMVMDGCITATLQFLTVPKQLWVNFLEASVRTSVEGFAFLHRVRYSSPNMSRAGRAANGNGNNGQRDSGGTWSGRKQKRSEHGAEDPTELLQRWRIMAAVERRRTGAVGGTRRQPPAPD